MINSCNDFVGTIYCSINESDSNITIFSAYCMVNFQQQSGKDRKFFNIIKQTRFDLVSNFERVYNNISGKYSFWNDMKIKDEYLWFLRRLKFKSCKKKKNQSFNFWTISFLKFSKLNNIFGFIFIVWSIKWSLNRKVIK